VAKLLVSVRSGDEARLAQAGGASIIDVKEPGQGPLGRAGFSVWRDVCAAVEAEVPVSVALGELTEWLGPDSPVPPVDAWAGINFRKLGLAGVAFGWGLAWQGLRARLDEATGPPWIAVICSDWQEALAPHPEEILAVAQESTTIAGVLVDTWNKGHRLRLDPGNHPWLERFSRDRRGKLLAIAGSLGLDTIPLLEPFAPDIVAVRGAACVGGDRRADVDPARVAKLAKAAAALPEPSSIRQVKLHPLRQR
jgi:(5-formylfuran-3-yl)methyl phosphate synthase